MVVDTLFVDARVHLPAGEVVHGWVGVLEEQIAGVGSGSSPQGRTVVDCKGQWMLPGLVDMHVHFRDPGFTYKEDFETGSAAAAAGGVTTVVDMPNTGRGVVSGADVHEKLSFLDGRSHVDYALYAGLYRSKEHMSSLCEIGVAGLKWMFGQSSSPFEDEGPLVPTLLRDDLQAAAEAGLLVGLHAEDAAWVNALESELQDGGRTDAMAHAASRPPFVEALAIVQALTLAEAFGNQIHIHHLSSSSGLDAICAMRSSNDMEVTVEVCPHHLYLTEEVLAQIGGRGRVNPPLRSKADAEALWEGVRGGTIDCIASDHAPHSVAEKCRDDIWTVPSGLIGVETTFPLLFHEVVAGELALDQFIRLTAETPAEITRLSHKKGKLLPGFDADLLIINPNGRTKIVSTSLHSKHTLTPFDGWERNGSITAVYLRGTQVVVDGRVCTEKRGAHVRSLASGAQRVV